MTARIVQELTRQILIRARSLTRSKENSPGRVALTDVSDDGSQTRAPVIPWNLKTTRSRETAARCLDGPSTRSTFETVVRLPSATRGAAQAGIRLSDVRSHAERAVPRSSTAAGLASSIAPRSSTSMIAKGPISMRTCMRFWISCFDLACRRVSATSRPQPQSASVSTPSRM
jgi:hypothetical protein